MVLGWRSDVDFNPFAGTMDDIAVYNKALTPQQVQTHFVNTVRLTITRSGNDVVLSWPFGTLQSAPAVTGTYTNVPSATSPLTNAPSQAGEVLSRPGPVIAPEEVTTRGRGGVTPAFAFGFPPVFEDRISQSIRLRQSQCPKIALERCDEVEYSSSFKNKAAFRPHTIFRVLWRGCGQIPAVEKKPPVIAEVLPTHTPELFRAAVQRAAELLRAGEVVALPTETVYGLAASALDAAGGRAHLRRSRAGRRTIPSSFTSRAWRWRSAASRTGRPSRAGWRRRSGRDR